MAENNLKKTLLLKGLEKGLVDNLISEESKSVGNIMNIKYLIITEWR